MAGRKTKVLFLIHDLGHGGAEKVLVNLVNNMDPDRFDVSVTALFGGGVNERFLAPHIHFRSVFPRSFPGNSHIMKLFSPALLHRLCVRERYDIEVSYLEGPSARVISGCRDERTKLVSWIHCTMSSMKDVAASFRSEREAKACYSRFDRMAFVCGTVKEAFDRHCPLSVPECVLYNTNESDRILACAKEEIEDGIMRPQSFSWCGVGRLIPVKRFDRMLRIQKRLIEEGYPVHFYVLGDGPLRRELELWCADNGVAQHISFLGYQTNPYKYIAACDLFVCSSMSEGFSTAATEALIVGTPVCTVEVSGMKEMLGENNEYGIVTENDEDALYRAIKRLLDDPALLAHYREKARERGKMFSTENTVRAVEEMLMELQSV